MLAGVLMAAPSASADFFANIARSSVIAPEDGETWRTSGQLPLTATPVERPGTPLPGDDAGDGQSELPSLPQLFAHALEHEASLTSQRLRAQAEGLEVPLAWARFKPQIDASLSRSYTRSRNIYTDGNVQSCIDDPETGVPAAGEAFERRCQGIATDTDRRLSLSQPLFSMERVRQLQKANRQRDAAWLQVETHERDLALQVAETYLDSFYYALRVDLLESKRESLDLQVRQAQRAYDLGIGDRIDLLAAQAEFDRTLADIAAARDDVIDSLTALERLTGITVDFDGFVLRELPVDGFEPPVVLAKLKDSIANNADVRLAEARRRLAHADIDTRRADYYPELTLGLSYSKRDSDDPYRDSEDKRATLQASVNLYRGGYTQTRVRQGTLLEKAAMADVANAQRQTWEQIRQYRRSIGADIKRLQALARSIDSGELYLEAADKGAALGLRDLVDVLDARADLYTQRIQYVEVFRRWLLDRLKLEAAVGDLDTNDMVNVMRQLNHIVARPATG
ncbi:TolC family protein [Salinicola endophyticus]|uniref:TolC family protein n=1 Tax=Salinicola endophyticus TaxID=1949083 RepID=A0AB74UD17_9GAMM